VQTGLEPEQNIYQTRVQKYKKNFEYANFLGIENQDFCILEYSKGKYSLIEIASTGH